MYSGHIAIPHCTKDSGGFDKWDDMLDYPTFENTAVTKHAHLHARQSFNRFSKYRFNTGDYDMEDSSKLNLLKVDDYAMYMALESKRNPVVPRGIYQPFVRAIILYMPDTNSIKFQHFIWHLESWKEMIKHQPLLWRTDVIVFTPHASSYLEQFNCTSERRNSQDDTNRCIVVDDYQSIHVDDFRHVFADSINVLATMDDQMVNQYEYFLRTDVETFLTPVFAKWKPSKLTFGTSGGYCFEGYPTCNRLKKISKTLGLNEPKDIDIGATWYGPSKLLKECAKLSMKIMYHMHANEFNATEKSFQYYHVQVKGWPRWHYGILYLYANHIAIQHCAKDVGFEKRNDMIDFKTISNDMISSHAHLRPPLSRDGDFSLLKYSDGEYNNLALENIQKETVSGYAMYMAVAAKKNYEASPIALRDLDKTFIRAAVVYLPSTRTPSNAKFFKEFRWFHASWQQMIKHEPPLWRTDIVVFTNGSVPLLNELGCTNSIRINSSAPSRCVVVENYEKVQSEAFDYAFADSINVVAIKSPATAPYDWILRTDIDTFFTPLFAKWKPLKLTVGSVGGYCFNGESTCDRLQAIAKKLKLTMPNRTYDVGSTWYGPAKLIQSCGKLSMIVIDHLHQHEFNATEKSREFYHERIAGWPSWHYGVLTMYAGHLAIHDCTKDAGGFDKRDDLIDFPTFSKDKLSHHAHLHAWQVANKDFAKAKFFSGAYDHMDSDSLDDSKVNEFALQIALDSNSKVKQFTHGLNESFVRAAVVYIPSTRDPNGETQFRWFHQSWREMVVKQPSQWRMDLVVFTTSELPLLKELGCTLDVRQNRIEPNRCIFVASYKSIVNESFVNTFADSFNAISINHEATAPYDWLIRTETETFFTPLFAKWKPLTMSVGQSSGYCFDGEPTCNRLVRVAKTLKLTEPKFMNIGMTWYGPAKLMRSCAKLTVDVMRYLQDHEFTPLERSHEYYVSKIAGWPSWHFGIVHSYAMHIALQHCAKDATFEIRGDMLDFSTLTKNKITKHAHLRPVLSRDGDFSLLRYREEAYVNVDLSSLNTKTVSGFAMYQALSSTRESLKNLLGNQLEKPFVRAAVIYLPSSNSAKFMSEFRWFHRSWREMIKFQPKSWRMDIVVFTDAHLPLLSELKCTTQLRRSPTELDRCIFIPTYKKVHSESFDYRFADSINVVAHPNPAIEPYEYILRTDIDTFLTPIFATWRPKRFTVGSVGGYCFDGHETCNRLRGISRKLNLTTTDVQDIGSTWYGPTKLIQSCGKLSMEVINHLHLHEFTPEERNPVKINWPEWHYGVLTMYSGHIAIPHCTLSTGFDKLDDMLDFPTYSGDKIERHAHIHARQEGALDFSKNKFQNGLYDNTNVQALNLSKVRDYATYIALISNRKTTYEFNISSVHMT